ncbi:MAG: dienelactone hydrolase family protein [Sphingomonadales bacterium]|nr:dienelactone hydrolase family protein [Sphingomonadales bacterium]
MNSHPASEAQHLEPTDTARAAPEQEHSGAITQLQIDQQVYDLYDEYCHGHIDRREFLSRAAGLSVVGGMGLVMAQALLPRYAQAQLISFTDPRIKANYVLYPSAGGNSGEMRGYLVQPKGVGPFPTVLVIHENRGLNPYIEDVARRAAAEGFLALAPDGLYPVGGYPGNDDDGRTLQGSLDQAKLRVDLLNSARYLKSHPLSNGKLGATGFCFGGGIVNYLAAAMGKDLNAGAPYYGVAADTEQAAKITAPLLIHLAETDERVNATYPAFEQALKKAKASFVLHQYPGTQHGFHNNSTPRYSEAAAKLSWQRTMEHFQRHLAGSTVTAAEPS